MIAMMSYLSMVNNLNEEPATSNPFMDPSLAQGYEAWYATQGRRADRLEKQLLKWLLKRFPKAHSILEVGCGTGHLTRWFESQGLRAVGLDISSVMLGEAKQMKNPAYVLADAHHLPFASQAFDLIALITTIEFLQDPLLALREAKRVARQGLILGVINCKSWIGREYRRQGGPVWNAARFFTPDELIQMVQKLEIKPIKPFWKTTLWKLWPWALPLPWGGFIGLGLSLDR